jgi:hypothetical protein
MDLGNLNEGKSVRQGAEGEVCVRDTGECQAHWVRELYRESGGKLPAGAWLRAKASAFGTQVSSFCHGAGSLCIVHIQQQESILGRDCSGGRMRC